MSIYISRGTARQRPQRLLALLAEFESGMPPHSLANLQREHVSIHLTKIAPICRLCP